MITVGTQYFDPAFAPTHQRFDYDNLFSGKINLFTDVGAAAHLGFAPLGAASMIRLRPCLAGFVPGATCWIRQNRSSKRRNGWHAGMVAEWDQNAALRVALRKRLIERIHTFNPDVIWRTVSGGSFATTHFRRRTNIHALAAI